MTAPAPQLPLLRLELLQTLRRLHAAHGDRPWSQADLGTVADVLARAVEERGLIDGGVLADYLDGWGAQMTTVKARWAAGWAAETVRKATADPSLLDRKPSDV